MNNSEARKREAEQRAEKIRRAGEILDTLGYGDDPSVYPGWGREDSSILEHIVNTREANRIPRQGAA